MGDWWTENTGGYDVGQTIPGEVSANGGRGGYDSSGIYNPDIDNSSVGYTGNNQVLSGWNTYQAPTRTAGGGSVNLNRGSSGRTSGGGGNAQPTYSASRQDQSSTQAGWNSGSTSQTQSGWNQSSTNTTNQSNTTGIQEGTNTQVNESTTTRTPTMPMPVLGQTKPYNNPAWNEEKIKSLAQEDAALGISESRDALYQGINKVVSMYGNPTAQSAAMRDLLKGHGSAIAKTMQGANKEALSRYQVQYAYQVQEAITRFDAAQKAIYAKYNADLQAYMNTMKQTTTGTSIGTYKGITNSNTTGTSTSNTSGTSGGTSTGTYSGRSGGSSTGNANQYNTSGYGDPGNLVGDGTTLSAQRNYGNTYYR